MDRPRFLHVTIERCVHRAHRARCDVHHMQHGLVAHASNERELCPVPAMVSDEWRRRVR